MKPSYYTIMGLFGCLALGILILGVPAPAFANTSDPTQISWSDLLSPVFTLFASASAAVFTAILVKVLKGIGINLNRQSQELVDSALQHCIGYGLQKASESKALKSNAKIENETIGQAVLYFHENWPDTVKRLNLTDERIEKMIRARIGEGDLLSKRIS